ncbi:MAG TPA: hypothetical protein VFO75_03740 [Candidatus Dormibacteraeota bacterium]|nr:hypothetical protein [Candidatus Dormibacteraeota bacterium]
MSQRFLMTVLVVAAAVTVLFAVGYVAAQQSVRHAADHPQIEMARDAVARLQAGASPTSVLPKTGVDLARSKDPYLILTDQEGKVLASSATLGGEVVVPPIGVFDYVRAHGEDVVTWQPAPGVRSAIAVDSWEYGFVVAGRSLEDTENAEAGLLDLSLGGWLVSMLVLGGVAAIRLRR